MPRGEILPLSYIPNVTASDTVCHVQHEGAGKRRALYRTLPHSTGDPPAVFW